MTLHAAHSVKLGATVIGGLTNLSNQANAQVDNEVGVGSPYPQFVVVRGQKPRISFATRDAAGLLDLTGSTGVAIDATDTLTATYAALGDDGLYAAGSVHRSYVADKGLLLPRSLSCQHQQDVQIDVDALLLSDGASAPITISDVAALPTIPVDNQRWTLGPVTLGGVTFSDVTSVQIDFGNSADTEGSGSDLWDKLLRQAGIQAVVTVTGLSAAVFASTGIPIEGKSATHATTSMAFRKRAPEGIGFVADATAEHIKITADGLAIVTQHTGQGPNRGEVTVQMTCRWDGTNAPLVITTAFALGI